MLLSSTAIEYAHSVDIRHKGASLDETLQIVAAVALLVHTVYQATLGHPMANIEHEKENGQTDIGKLLNLLDLLRSNIFLQLLVVPIT